jgi:membrane protein required for colicin V production
MFIDIVFAVLLVMAAVKGYQKGFVLAVFSILAFIIGLAAALKLSTAVAAYLADSVNVSAKWLPFIAFILVFLAVVIAVRLGGRFIEKTIQFALLGWANRIAGILLYAALYTIILSIVVFYAEKMMLLQPAVIQSSLTYTFIKPAGPLVIDNMGLLIPWFQDMFTQLEVFFDTLHSKISH